MAQVETMMDPILLLKPEIRRHLSEDGYRRWNQRSSGEPVAVTLPRRARQIASDIRRLTASRRQNREPRRVALALDDNLSGS
jgi:hypothetical protein